MRPDPRSSTSTIARSSCALAALTALGLLSGGCGGAPHHVTTPAEAPAPHLRGHAEDDAPAARHDAPLPDPTAGAEVSLAGILAFADQRSPVLAVARSTRSRAEAARVAASILMPTNPVVTVAAGPRFGLTGRGVDVEVSLTQQVQIAGERGLRVEAADALGALTAAEIEQLRWAVHCDVHAAFHRALVEQQRARLAAQVVDFQESVLGAVERRIKAGDVAPLALRLAQAEVAQAKQVSVAATQARLVARIRLAQLAGWPVSSPPEPAGEVDAPREPPSQAALGVVARERLPSLRAAGARVREAEARARLAGREAWPRPSLGVQYRREGNPSSEGAYDIVMGVVSVPITSFQRNQGEQAHARADARVAEAEQDAARRLLDGQIAEARSEVVAASARARAYRAEILPRFEENLSLLRRSFELGEIDLLALSAGRERFLRIQSDALDAQQAYFVALAALERVVGVDLWHDDHGEGAR